jgi:hypothetical protein
VKDLKFITTIEYVRKLGHFRSTSVNGRIIYLEEIILHTGLILIRRGFSDRLL